MIRMIGEISLLDLNSEKEIDANKIKGLINERDFVSKNFIY